MKESEPTLEQFKVMLCHRRLDPVELDIEKMHAAWCLLRQHLEKLQTTVHGVQTNDSEPCVTLPQFVFTPTSLLSQRNR